MEKILFEEFVIWLADGERPKGSYASYMAYDGMTYKDALKASGEGIPQDPKNPRWDEIISAEEFLKAEQELSEY